MDKAYTLLRFCDISRSFWRCKKFLLSNTRFVLGVASGSPSAIGSFAVVTSPEINLKDAVEPILKFAYRNEQFDGLLNKFEAYYRIHSDSSWVLLLSIDERQKMFKEFEFVIADSLKTEHYCPCLYSADKYNPFLCVVFYY